MALRRRGAFRDLTLAFAELLHLLVANIGFLGRNDGLSGCSARCSPGLTLTWPTIFYYRGQRPRRPDR
jgi:ABC-type branched-subunit amino acid transport system permease subunit